MRYIVIDKDGKDISDQVQVIQETTDTYSYCRREADKMLKIADEFHENEIMSRYYKMRVSMDEFGPEFDPDRSRKWSEYLDNLSAEIGEKSKEWNAMMEIAGDWEDREWAARWKGVVDFLAARSENPLQEKLVKNTLMGWYCQDMGVPSMAKYISTEPMPQVDAKIHQRS